MKNECSIVRDLLPLYAEHLTSSDTNSFVEAHLKCCATCRAELDAMKQPNEIPIEMDSKPLKNLKKKLMVKKIQTIAWTVVFVLAIVVAALAVMDTPLFYPYSEDCVSLTENTDGSLTVTFSEEITDYRCELSTTDPDTGSTIYYIEAWSSFWAQQFTKRGIQSTTIVPKDNTALVVYYAQNNGEADVCLYNNSGVDYGGVITLPRLTLGYYLLIDGAVLAVLLFAWFVFRKSSKARVWIERALLLPVSYAAGHLIVMGFNTVSYALVRDFLIIVLLTLLIYCCLLLGHNIFRLRKEIRQTK